MPCRQMSEQLCTRPVPRRCVSRVFRVCVCVCVFMSMLVRWLDGDVYRHCVHLCSHVLPVSSLSPSLLFSLFFLRSLAYKRAVATAACKRAVATAAFKRAVATAASTWRNGVIDIGIGIGIGIDLSLFSPSFLSPMFLQCRLYRWCD